MWDNIVGANIRRANRNLAIVNIAVIVIVLLVAAFSLDYYREFFTGPHTLTAGEVEAARTLDDFANKFVSVTMDRNFGKVATLESDGEVTAEFYAFAIGEKFVIAKLSPGTKGKQFTGVLRAGDQDEQREIFGDSDMQEALRQGSLLPVILDTKQEFRTGGYIGLVVGIPLLLLGAFNLLRFLQRNGDPARHPAARALARYGDPAQVAMGIDMQARNPAALVTIGKNVRLTPGWLLRPTTFGLDVLRLEDIVWVYKRVTQHRVNFIPAGKTYALVINDRNRKALELQAGEKEVERAGIELAQRAPWIIAGYSAELEKTWRSNPAAIIQAVDQRRAQMNSGSPASMAPVASSTPPAPNQ